MITTQNNHKRVYYKHCLKVRTAHARGHVLLSKNNASQMRCFCLVLLNFHTMASDTLKTKTASLLWLNQDRRFLLPTRVYDHKYLQKLHRTQKVKICSYVILSYEGSNSSLYNLSYQPVTGSDFRIFICSVFCRISESAWRESEERTCGLSTGFWARRSCHLTYLLHNLTVYRVISKPLFADQLTTCVHRAFFVK